MSTSFSRIRFWLFTGLLVLAPLSKYPSVALPLFNFSSFRIGLYQVLAATFVATCAVPAWRKRYAFFDAAHAQAWAATSLLLLGLLGIASIGWSLYTWRSLLLSASFALLVALAFTAWWYVRNELSASGRKKILRYMLLGGVIYGVIAVLQLVFFSFSDQTLGILCRGCVADVFGFPRVNGLAAEPQFFANALLPFAFVSLYAVVARPSRLAWASLFASVGAIGLTFSRGAYLALAIGLSFCLVTLYTSKLINIRKSLQIFGILSAAIVVSLTLLVASASVRFASTPHIAYETVDSIFEHLTLGLVDLPEKPVVPVDPAPLPQQDTFVSPGLIEASNEERTTAASLALDAWRSNWATVVLGVGLGNLGPFVVQHIQPSAPENLTVYIHYVLVLAELGLAGLVALVVVFGVAIASLVARREAWSTLLASLLVAFAIQLFFYGTYINNVYIYAWLGIALGAALIQKSTSVRKQRV